jgi:hypothetical protein
MIVSRRACDPLPVSGRSVERDTRQPECLRHPASRYRECFAELLRVDHSATVVVPLTVVNSTARHARTASYAGVTLAEPDCPAWSITPHAQLSSTRPSQPMQRLQRRLEARPKARTVLGRTTSHSTEAGPYQRRLRARGRAASPALPRVPRRTRRYAIWSIDRLPGFLASFSHRGLRGQRSDQ